MTVRTITIAFLFLIAVAICGVVFGGMVAAFGPIPWPAGAWMLPLFLFASFVSVFFIGRAYVLAPAVAGQPLRAFALLSAWMAATLIAATAITWVINPVLERLEWDFGGLGILLLCLVASVGVLDRVSAAT